MGSTLSVSELKGLTSGSDANKIKVPTGQVFAAPGHIIQTKQQVWTTENVANTTSDYPVASGVKLSITPTYASSKILVIANIDAWLDAGSNNNQIGKYGLRLNSQSNTLVAEKRFSFYSAGGTTDFGGEVSMMYLDSPNSTSAQEYEVVLGRWSSTYNNNVKINGGGFGHSSMTLMEIAT